MPGLYKKFVQSYLNFCIKVLFFKYNLKIIIIAGCGNNQRIKNSIKNYLNGRINFKITPDDCNDKISAPLGILGLKMPKKGFFRWFFTLFDALSVALFFSEFPKIIITDINISKKEDADYFYKLFKPKVLILSNINNELKETYLRLAGLMPEKGLVALNLKDGAQNDIDILIAKIKYFSSDNPIEAGVIVEKYVKGEYVY